MNALKNKKLPFFFLGVLLFNFLFWEIPLGLNALIFSGYMLLGVLLFYRESLKSHTVLVTVFGHLATAVLLVLNNSDVAIFGWCTSFLLMIGFIQQPALRSIIYAIPTSLGNLFRFPLELGAAIPKGEAKLGKVKSAWRFVRLSILPFLVLGVFYWIFKFSNHVFDSFTSDIWTGFLTWLEQVFKNISLLRVLFILLGAVLTAWFLFNAQIKTFLKREAGLSDFVKRVRQPFTPATPRRDYSMYSGASVIEEPKTGLQLGLKNEYRSGVMLVVMVNLLLLIVNSIDVWWVWFNFEYKTVVNLKQFVHEGTYLLILSILLSMGILLYFFRRNQNFYTGKKWLKRLAYIWIVQNCILAISVGVRNFHYINHYGLAYKRIGVIIFLLLTIIGLITLYLKIRDRKSAFYLLRINSWSVYAALIFTCTVSWDSLIARHNLAHNYKQPIDMVFLLSLSDKTLPIIESHAGHIDWRENITIYRNGSGITFRKYYEQRRSAFLAGKEQEPKLAWNYAEYKAYKSLKEQEKEDWVW